MRSLGRAKIVRAGALLNKSPFRADALLQKVHSERALFYKKSIPSGRSFTKSPFRACSVSAPFGMADCQSDFIMNHDQTVCRREHTLFIIQGLLIYLFAIHSSHHNLCRDSGSLFSSIYHTPLPSTFVSQSVCPSVYMNLFPPSPSLCWQM